MINFLTNGVVGIAPKATGPAVLYSQNFEGLPLLDLDGQDGWSRVEGAPEKPFTVDANAQLEGAKNALIGPGSSLTLYRRLLAFPPSYDAEFMLFKEAEGEFDMNMLVGCGAFLTDNHNVGFDWIVQHISDMFGAMNMRFVVNGWGTEALIPIPPGATMTCRVERRQGALTSFYVNGGLQWTATTSALLGTRIVLDGNTSNTSGRADAIRITAA